MMFESRSRGFCRPLLGQPFYGWSPAHTGRFLRRSVASSDRAGPGVGDGGPTGRPAQLFPSVVLSR